MRMQMEEFSAKAMQARWLLLGVKQYGKKLCRPISILKNTMNQAPFSLSYSIALTSTWMMTVLLAQTTQLSRRKFSFWTDFSLVTPSGMRQRTRLSIRVASPSTDSIPWTNTASTKSFWARVSGLRQKCILFIVLSPLLAILLLWPCQFTKPLNSSWVTTKNSLLINLC